MVDKGKDRPQQDTPQADVCHRAGERIRTHQEEILNEWLQGAFERVPAAQDKGRTELADHFVELLCDIADVLQHTASRRKVEDRSDLLAGGGASMMHGRERAVVSGYTVDQLANEYAILRRVLRDFCYEQGVAQVDVLEIITQVIEIASLTSVSAFAGAMEDLRQKLASTLLHDVRTPLGVAYTYAEMMALDGATGGQRRRASEVVTRSLRRATVMLEELLDVAKLEAGKGMAMKFGKADLNYHVQAICDEADQVYPHEIETKLPKDPVLGIFDIGLISRTLENLISNAAKFGSDDSPITVSLEDEPERVTLRVHNLGNAIPQADRKNIFSFFSTPTERGEVTTKGWGLGLSLIKAVAANHGGEVIFESDRDEGTTFGMVLLKNYRRDGEKISVLV